MKLSVGAFSGEQTPLDKELLSRIIHDLSGHSFIELRKLEEGSPILSYKQLPPLSLYVPGEGIFPPLQERLGPNEIGIEGRSYWQERYGAFMEGDGEQMGVEAQKNLHGMLEGIYNEALKRLRIPKEDLARMVWWTKWVVDISFALLRGVLRLEDVFSFFRNNPPVAAFVIPTRVGTRVGIRRGGEFLSEITAHLPAACFMDDELLCMFLSQCPPIFVDVKWVKGLYVLTLWVPITERLVRSENGSINPEGMRRAREIINAGVRFLLKQNIPIIGLGGAFPSLTKYGRTVTEEVPTAVITTGHAGTCVVIRNIVEKISSMLALPLNNIAVIGVGSIGRAIADAVLADYSDTTLTLYDIRKEVVREVYNGLLARYGNRVRIGRFQDVVSGVVGGPSIQIAISTATSPISPNIIRGMIDKLGVRVFIDDSQPPSIDPSSLEGTNAILVWVVESSPDYERFPVLTFPTQGGAVRWNYGDQGVGVVGSSVDFGCAKETAALALLLRLLLKKYGYRADAVERALEAVRRCAINRPVEPKDVERMRKLFDHVGLSSLDSTFQAFGKPVVIQK